MALGPARTAEDFFRHYRAGCNAQTGDRYTVFATVFPREDLEKELTEAAARMGDLRITAADLDREKSRLLDEISNMFGRIPTLGAVNIARELMRPAPRGGRKGGLPADVQAVTLDDVRSYWKRYYKPRNAILVLVGSLDEAAARQAVAAHFAGLAAGEDVPEPGEPGTPQAGSLSELAVKTFQPQVEPVACLMYAAPEPNSEFYAAFLVLVARFWAASAQTGGAGAIGRPSVYFPLLEDPAVVGVSAIANPGETAARASARLESFVAQTIARPLRDDERASAPSDVRFLSGHEADIPDFFSLRTPHGVALSLARAKQMGIDFMKLNRIFDALTERDLGRAAGAIFSPDRHAGAFSRRIRPIRMA